MKFEFENQLLSLHVNSSNRLLHTKVSGHLAAEFIGTKTLKFTEPNFTD